MSVIPTEAPGYRLAYRLFTLLAFFASSAWSMDWPQEITAEEGTVVIYQPQPESLEGDILKSRAAFSLELKGKEEPIFGAMWFDARLETDKDNGIARVVGLKVTKVGWPDSKDADEQRLTHIIQSAVPDSGFEISMERLSASLVTAEVEQKSLQELKSEPPEIRFSQELAVLLLYDGKPRFSAVENSPYERALNTMFLVAHNTESGNYYLGNGDFWYESRDALGPWKVTQNPPADLVSMIEPADDAAEGPTRPPVVVVATKPTELISTDGKPAWKPLTGGELLYVENTESAWLRDLGTGNMYVLLSGRWYRARSESGPWTFVPADELPESFKDIPPASDIGGLRVSVAGTEEAEEAMLDASIPQTAVIERSEASLTVEYDGTPKFEKIPGTSVSYAVNTGAQVLQVSGKYYAVDQGVWFTAPAATGPWAVADEVPEEEIAKIPPSSPVYNTTHVHIYESTPQVVYVGYTPGYLWSFPYYGVPVYGTGWYYPPYMGRYYYPRPPTWGFNVGYNPWTGWNFGLSWSNGFFSFGMSWGGGWGGNYRPWGCCGGWYGGGYRGPTIINTGDINIGNSVSVGNRTSIGNRMDKNTRISANNRNGRNIYDRPENRQRIADKSSAKQLKQARPAQDRANNVYADKNGAVARRTDAGWETRNAGRWERDELAAKVPEETRDRAAAAAPQARAKVDGISEQQRQQAAQQARDRAATAQRPATTAKPQQQIDRRDLNRAHQARQTGASRERARPQRSAPRRR